MTLDGAEEGRRVGHEGRPDKRRRLEIRTEHAPEDPPAAGQSGKRSQRWPQGGLLLLRWA